VITVILPCAGYGTRLGLSFPKELYEVVPGWRLVDFSLQHIIVGRYICSEVVVVIRKGKEGVADYLSKRLFAYGITVRSFFYNDSYYEWAGSVMSAEEAWGERSLVLLPDSVVRCSEKDPLRWGKTGLLEAMDGMLREYSVGFAVCRAQGERLSSLGALRIENGRVMAFQDKPVDPSPYNGFWVSYGFHQRFGRELYEFLVRSIRHENGELPPGLFPAPVVEVAGYTDLGTWPAIEHFRLQWQEEEALWKG